MSEEELPRNEKYILDLSRIVYLLLFQSDDSNSNTVLAVEDVVLLGGERILGGELSLPERTGLGSRE